MQRTPPIPRVLNFDDYDDLSSPSRHSDEKNAAKTFLSLDRSSKSSNSSRSENEDRQPRSILRDRRDDRRHAKSDRVRIIEPSPPRPPPSADSRPRPRIITRSATAAAIIDKREAAAAAAAAAAADGRLTTTTANASAPSTPSRKRSIYDDPRRHHVQTPFPLPPHSPSRRHRRGRTPPQPQPQPSPPMSTTQPLRTKLRPLRRAHSSLTNAAEGERDLHAERRRYYRDNSSITAAAADEASHNTSEALARANVPIATSTPTTPPSKMRKLTSDGKHQSSCESAVTRKRPAFCCMPFVALKKQKIFRCFSF